MAAPCFSKRFYEESDDEFDKALRTMKAAVASARAGSDEAVKQVQFVHFLVRRNGLVWIMMVQGYFCGGCCAS